LQERLTLDTHELAWAAGIFDGEGHIRCELRARLDGTFGSPRMIFSVPQKDRRIPDRLVKAFGMGKVLGPYQNRKNTIYHFNISNFEHAQAAIAAMWKWLSPVKRAQASAALLRYRSVYEPDVLQQAA